MQTLPKLQKNYTLNHSGYQLKLPLDLDCMIPQNDSVQLLSQFVEGMDLTDLYSTYQRIREKRTPRLLLKIMLYSYMNGCYSSRSMEQRCKRDLNFMYLLEGLPAPDHATFARFRSIHFAPCATRIMAQMSDFLYETGEISGDSMFVDGTKLEAYANKYTFVWKKAVTRHLANLLEKLASFVEECESLFGIKLVYQKQVKLKHVKKLRKKLYALKEKEGISFVHGSGRKKSPLQKRIEQLEEYLKKLKEYTNKLHLCGPRNSYSKTDPDATFMRMKEDAMGNGQLKAAYNLQHAIDSEYIVWLAVGPQPTDTSMLIPLIKEMEGNLSFQYKKVVADAGYESEENYEFLKENGQQSYIKPSNYERSKTRKYQKDIGRIEHMAYEKETDCYTCVEGRKLTARFVKRERTKSGYRRETTVYSCTDCSGCHQKKECIKGNHSKIPMEERNKNLYVSKKFLANRNEDLARIQSEEGCQLRMNRSIQAEGSFGELKQDMGFRRYLSRGSSNVTAESILLALAHNLKKLHHKIQSGKTGRHLFPLKKTR